MIRWSVAFLIAFALLSDIPNAQADVHLTARVRTQESGGKVWLREEPSAGRPGRGLQLLTNGSSVEFDVDKLLELIGNSTSTEARVRFFSQDSCSAFQSAWKEMLAPASLSGQKYHYLPVSVGSQKGFVSVEYLSASGLRCEDLRKALLAKMVTPAGVCDVACVWNGVTSNPGIENWAQILAATTGGLPGALRFSKEVAEICPNLKLESRIASLPQPVTVCDQVPAGSLAKIRCQALEQAPELTPYALDAALVYFARNRSRIRNQSVLSVVDFSLPAHQKRMFVIDLQSGALEKYLVAHGEGSGMGLYPTEFSNRPGSNQSSIGPYLTGDIIESPRWGDAMLLEGQSSTNSNAISREVIFHSAPTVSDDNYARGFYFLSQGCLTVDPLYVDPLRRRLTGRSLIYVQGPRPG